MDSLSPQYRRSPTGQRRYAGSGNFDLYAWLYLRISGVVLLFLVFGHVVIVHLLNDITAVNYSFVAARWASPFWRTYDWLMLILALSHGMVGLKTVADDYVHRPLWRIFALVAIASFGLVFVVAGSLVILTFQPV